MVGISVGVRTKNDQTTRRGDGVLVTWRESPRAVKALLVGVFVNRLGAFIHIFLVLFLTDRGFSAGQTGLALGVYGAGAVVGSLIGGTLSDRLDPRSVILISMFGSAVLIVSILYVPAYPLLLLAVLLVGTVGVFYRPAAQSLITELTPASRLVMVTAMYRLSLNLGTTVAPLVGAALVTVSYDLLFWGEAAAALIYVSLALAAIPRRITRTDRPVDQPAPADRLADGPDPDRTPARSRGYLAILADGRYTVFLLMIFLTSAVYVQYTATLPLAITDAGLSLWWYGGVVSLNGLVVITCELLMTRVVQSWHLRVTLFAGFAPVVLGYGLYAIGMIPAVLVIGTLIWTIAEIIGAPTVFAYPGMTAPARLRGRYLGAMQSMFGLGTAVGPIVGIMLWNQVGQAVWLWIALAAALATVAAQIGIRVPAAKPAPEPES
jgi:predicted MFS family arabinose efflux permease